MAKKRVAFYDLTGCSGCMLNILNLEPLLLDIADKVEIVAFPMAQSEFDINEPVDIAFFDGSVSTPEDEHILKTVRERAKYVVALGSCATWGGFQSRLNPEDQKREELMKNVYGNVKLKNADNRLPLPLKAYVEVDYELPDCPVDQQQFLTAFSSLINDNIPDIPKYPVCLECKAKLNQCVAISKGEICLGPITLGGCGARRPSSGIPCLGCRGPIYPDVYLVEVPEMAKRIKYFSGGYYYLLNLSENERKRLGLRAP